MPATDPTEIPQVKDKRPKIKGLLPKNTQGLVLGGIALLMVLVILFSGHNAPKPRTTPDPPTASAVMEPNQARILDYRTRIDEQMRRLAAEEAELAHTKQAFATNEPAPSSAGRMPINSQSYGLPASTDRSESEKNWIDRDRQKREYQSLYASNVALTYRREAEPQSAAHQAAASEPKSPRLETGSTGALDSASSVTQTSQYRLFEGTLLETVLTNRLDSTFSGPINCMVTTNVYSHDGENLLIPQGSRVLGEVKKLGSFGEQRLAVLFHRLIMPDGFSVSLDQFKGLDQIGETGLRDQVNHHYLQVFGVSIAIGALAGLSQANTRYGLDESGAQAYEQGVASSLSQSSLHILDRYLNVLPTFTIREGYRIKVYLSQDLMLPSYEQHPVRNDL